MLARNLLWLGVLLLPGCHRTRAAPAASAPSATADTTITGTVAVVGSDPSTQVVLQGAGPTLGLVGSLQGELRALAGVEVTVTGRRVTGEVPLAAGGIDVAGYEVVSVGGRRPEVGSLVSRGGDLWLASSDTVRLIGAPAELRSRIGAKLWVIGIRRDGALQLESYGVIRAGTR